MIILRIVTVLIVAFVLVACLIGGGRADFDREQCLNGCRGRFWGPGTMSDEDPSYVAQRPYESCVMECERKFWQEFDRKIRDTERAK